MRKKGGSPYYIISLDELSHFILMPINSLVLIPELLADKPCDICGVVYQLHKDKDHYFRYED